jgi:hypothetical protein
VARNEARAWKAEIFSVKDQSKDPTKMFETCRLLGCPTTTQKPGLKDYGLSEARNTSQASLAVKLQRVMVSAKGIYNLLPCKTDSSMIFISLLYCKVFSSII